MSDDALIRVTADVADALAKLQTVQTALKAMGDTGEAAGKGAGDKLDVMGAHLTELSRIVGGVSGEWIKLVSAFATGQVEAEAVIETLKVSFEALKEATVGLVEHAIDSANALENLSLKTGLSEEKASTLGAAFKAATGSTETLGRMVLQLGRNLDTTPGRMDGVRAALDKLGIEQSKFWMAPTDERILMISDAYIALGEGVNKAGISMELFNDRTGTSAQALQKPLRELTEQAKAMGLEMSESQVDAAANLERQWSLLGQAWDRAKTTIGVALVPAFTKLVESFTTNRLLMNELVIAANDAAHALETLAGAIHDVYDADTGLGMAIGALIPGFATYQATLKGAAEQLAKQDDATEKLMTRLVMAHVPFATIEKAIKDQGLAADFTARSIEILKDVWAKYNDTAEQTKLTSQEKQKILDNENKIAVINIETQQRGLAAQIAVRDKQLELEQSKYGRETPNKDVVEQSKMMNSMREVAEADKKKMIVDFQRKTNAELATLREGDLQDQIKESKRGLDAQVASIKEAARFQIEQKKTAGELGPGVAKAIDAKAEEDIQNLLTSYKQKAHDAAIALKYDEEAVKLKAGQDGVEQQIALMRNATAKTIALKKAELGEGVEAQKAAQLFETEQNNIADQKAQELRLMNAKRSREAVAAMDATIAAKEIEDTEVGVKKQMDLENQRYEEKVRLMGKTTDTTQAEYDKELEIHNLYLKEIKEKDLQYNGDVLKGMEMRGYAFKSHLEDQLAVDEATLIAMRQEEEATADDIIAQEQRAEAEKAKAHDREAVETTQMLADRLAKTKKTLQAIIDGEVQVTAAKKRQLEQQARDQDAELQEERYQYEQLASVLQSISQASQAVAGELHGAWQLVAKSVGDVSGALSSVATAWATAVEAGFNAASVVQLAGSWVTVAIAIYQVSTAIKGLVNTTHQQENAMADIRREMLGISDESTHVMKTAGQLSTIDATTEALRRLGVATANITTGMATEIQQLADSLKKLDSGLTDATARHYAELIMLDKVIDDLGGLTSQNLTLWETQATRLFEVIAKGGQVGEQATQELSKMIDKFAGQAATTGGVWDDTFKKLLADSLSLQKNVEQITKLIDDQVTKLSGGLNTVASDVRDKMEQDFTKITGLTREQATKVQTDLDNLTTKANDALSLADQQRLKSLKETRDAILKSGSSTGDQKKQFDDLNASIADLMAKSTGAMSDAERASLISLQQQHDAIVEANRQIVGNYQEEFDRVTHIALDSFDTMIKSGKSIPESISAIGPAIDALVDSATKFGIQGDETYDKLKHWRDLVQNNQPLLTQMSGLNDIMTAQANLNGLTADSFKRLQEQGASTYDKLIAAGFTTQEAEAATIPFLQNVIKLSKEKGLAIDENTQKMIDQATQDGLMSKEEETTNDVLREGIGALITLLGGQLPEAWKKAAEAAKTAADTTSDAAKQAGKDASDAADAAATSASSSADDAAKAAAKAADDASKAAAQSSADSSGASSDAAKEAADEATKAAIQAAEDAANAAKAAAQGSVDAANTAASDISDILKIEPQVDPTKFTDGLTVVDGSLDATKQKLDVDAQKAWENMADKAKTEAAKAQDGMAKVQGSVENAAQVLNQSNWTSWADDIVDAAKRAQDAVDGVTFGHSPGGLRDLINHFGLATDAAGAFADSAVTDLGAAKDAVDATTTLPTQVEALIELIKTSLSDAWKTAALAAQQASDDAIAATKKAYDAINETFDLSPEVTITPKVDVAPVHVEVVPIVDVPPVHVEITPDVSVKAPHAEVVPIIDVPPVHVEITPDVHVPPIHIEPVVDDVKPVHVTVTPDVEVTPVKVDPVITVDPVHLEIEPTVTMKPVEVTPEITARPTHVAVVPILDVPPIHVEVDPIITVKPVHLDAADLLDTDVVTVQVVATLDQATLAGAVDGVNTALDSTKRKLDKDTQDAWRDAADVATTQLDRIDGSLSTVRASLDTMSSTLKHSDWTSWADDMVDAAQRAQAAVDGITFGHSPGGLVDVIRHLSLAGTATTQFADHASADLLRAKAMVDNISGGLNKLAIPTRVQTGLLATATAAAAASTEASRQSATVVHNNYDNRQYIDALDQASFQRVEAKIATASISALEKSGTLRTRFMTRVINRE